MTDLVTAIGVEPWIVVQISTGRMRVATVNKMKKGILLYTVVGPSFTSRTKAVEFASEEWKERVRYRKVVICPFCTTATTVEYFEGIFRLVRHDHEAGECTGSGQKVTIL